MSVLRIWAYHLMDSFCLGSSQGYRSFHTNRAYLSRVYTREPNPIPGSDEHLNPNGWAKKLFKLQGNKSSLKVESEPHLLHMICRLKPLKGIIHYQRAILEKYGLGKDVKCHSWKIVKNVPSVNQELYQIKHLIKIQPILFPQGALQKTDDLTKCRLLPDGRFLKYRGTAVEATVTGSENSIGKPKDIAEIFTHISTANEGYLKRSYLRQWNNRSWNSSRLLQPFFCSHYKYKLNQDGKEYRYSKLWRLDNAMFDSVKSKLNNDGTFKGPNSNRFEADWNTYPWSKY